MKKVLFTMSIMITFLLCLTSCYEAPNEALVEATCDDFIEHNTIYKKAVVAKDGLLVVGLCPSPTAGFEWDWSTSNPGIVDEVDHHYEPTRADVNNAAGIDVWSFKATKRGNTSITMEQVRTVVPEEKGPYHLDISVSVR